MILGWGGDGKVGKVADVVVSPSVDGGGSRRMVACLGALAARDGSGSFERRARVRGETYTVVISESRGDDIEVIRLGRTRKTTGSYTSPWVVWLSVPEVGFDEEGGVVATLERLELLPLTFG